MLDLRNAELHPASPHRMATTPARPARAQLVDDHLARRGTTAGAIRAALELAEHEVAYLTGSITDGVGDAQSDLDVYILADSTSLACRAARFDSERQGQQARQGFGIIYFELNGESFDAECHLKEKFLELFGELQRIDPLDPDCLHRTFRSLGRFDRPEAVELLHRFRTGVAFHNGDEFNRMRAAFEERKFLLWNAHFHLLEAEDFLKGVRRSLLQEDAQSAYLKLVRLYDSLADARLFLAGESLDRWKWRLPKLRKVGDPKFLDLYLRVQLARSEGGPLDAWVRDLWQTGSEIRRQLFDRLSHGLES
jgi:hypothetical protein